MTTSVSNPAPQRLPTLPTIADLIAWITAHPTLSARRRDDMASALRKLAQALGRPAGTVPASPAHLNESLSKFAPQTAGLTAQRWANIQSLTRGAFKLAGLMSMPGRHATPMAPEWLALHELLPDMTSRVALSRFCHYVSDQDLSPQAVSDETMAEFCHVMQTGGLIKQPQKVYQTTCKQWNRAVQLVPAWPQTTLAVPCFSKTYILPWDRFPATLMEDVARYLEHEGGLDLFADTEIDFRPLRPSTVAHHRYLLREAAAAFVHDGGEPATLRTLSDLIQPASVKRVLTYLQLRANAEKSKQMYNVAKILMNVAEHWVRPTPGAPTAPAAPITSIPLSNLQKLVKRLKPHDGWFTEKNRRRLQQFDTDEQVLAILNLPQRIEKSVRKLPVSQATALMMQTAVMVEILIMTQLRVTNLAELTIGRSVITTGRGTMHLSIPPADVKNDMPIDRVLDPHSVGLIKLYNDKYRLVLVKHATNALFPGSKRASKSVGRVREQLTTTILKLTGIRMNPHLFRHFTAKHYLRDHNGAYGTLRLALGHKSVTTTERFYCSAEDEQAFRLLDEHIMTKRRSTRLGDGLGRREQWRAKPFFLAKKARRP